MKTINERLAEVLAFLCEQNGLNPYDLSSKPNGRLLIENREEIKQLRETINYLKDYAKIKVVAQSIADTEGLSKSIDDAIASLQVQIEETRKKIAGLPNKKRTKIPNDNLFGFEAQIAAQKLKKIEEYNANLDAQKQNLKSDIQAMKDKIKELQEMKKDLGNPTRMMNRLFGDKSYEQASNYSRLINLCAASITDGARIKGLIGEDKVFTYDENTQQYTVNQKNARKLISTIKKKKDLIDAVEYIKAKRDGFEKAGRHKNTSKRIELLKKTIDIKKATDAWSSEQLKYIHNTINSVIKDYNNLLETEYNDYEGNPFKRTYRSFLYAIGFRRLADMPSRKVRRKSAELEKKIKDLIEEVNTKPELKEIYETYINARSNVEGQESLTLDNLLIASRNLTEGFARFDLPRKTRNLGALLVEIENAKRKLEQEAEELEAEQAASNQKAEEMHAALSAGSLKILDEYSEDVILDLAKDYYDVSTEGRFSRTGTKVLSSSAAIMILEGILSRKNISFETICNSYAEILGANGVSEERTDLTRLMEDKAKFLQERIAELARPKASEVENNTADQPGEITEIA